LSDDPWLPRAPDHPEDPEPEVAPGEEGSVGEAAHGACAGAAFGSEAVAKAAEHVFDELAAATDGAVVEVADAALEVLGEGEFALGLQDAGDVLGLEGAAEEFAVGSETFAAFVAFEEEVLAVGFQGAGEGELLALEEGGDEELDRGAGARAAGEGFGVAAPAVVLGVEDDASADRVEVDVGGDGEEGGASAVDEDAFEAFFPEGAAALVAGVEPLGEALFEHLHEGGEIEHAGVEGGEVVGKGSRVIGLGEGVEALADGVGELEAGEAAEVCDDLVRGGEEVGRGFGWDFEEDVEVVGEDGVGEDANAAEAFAFAEEGDEAVFVEVGEEEATIDDAGNAVVEGDREVRGDLEPGAAHDGIEAGRNDRGYKRLL
jgi:hypothetical protein